MAPRTIVAVCSTTGPGSGKTTFLETWLKPLLPNAVHMRFSDPIVSFLCDGLNVLHGRGRDDYEALKRDELLPGITGRDFMIAAGDTLRNTLSESFYADILMERVKRLAWDRDVVIDDLRKMPELNKLADIKHTGVMIINVVKPCDINYNDSEFSRNSLVKRFYYQSHIKYLEYTWDGAGSFVRTNR